MRKIKVLVACGAGIATSTVVMKRIEDLLQDNNIEADVEQIKIAEAVSKQEGAD
ncbi:MAG: PTS galactitol transporter subunit IIB, partial [Lactobacillus sp.]|nr:PTS galactitol transporter subunit IIB [Lactobacillus sp.]